MNIAFLLPDNFIGGGIFTVFEHARRLIAKGHRVVIGFADPSTSLSIVSYDGMDQVETAYLETLVVAEPFDVAIATAWQTAYQVTNIPARAYVYFVQDDERRFYAPPGNRVDRYLSSQSYRQAFHFIVSAKWLQKMLRDEYGKESAVVPYAIDPVRFQDITPLRSRGSRLRVLVEGRTGESRKRIPLTFEVLDAVDNVEVFYVSSDGSHEANWKIDEFFEKVPYRLMPEIFASCDLILKLSSQESFGLPVLEMFTSGGTAVVTAYTGHDQFIVDQFNALVVPIDDKEAAIAALKRLRDDPALLAKLRQNALSAVEKFNWNLSSHLMEQHLQRIVSGVEHEKRPAISPVLAMLFRFRKVPGTLRRKIMAALKGGNG